MSTNTLKAIPGLFELDYYPGNPLDFAFVGWPHGYLTGRHFTLRVGTVDLDAVVEGDTIKVTATGDQTTAIADQRQQTVRLVDTDTQVTLSTGRATMTLEGGTATNGPIPVQIENRLVHVELIDLSGPAAAVQANLDAHLADPTNAHPASAVSVDTTGFTHATGDDAQTVLGELDTAITAGGGGGAPTGPAGGALGGTYPSPTLSTAKQAELDAKATQTGLDGAVSTINTALAGKQPIAAALTTLAGAGNSATLAATTAVFTTAKDTKLTGIATGATANATDGQLRDRSTHTNTQLASTISDFAATVQAFRLDQLTAPTADVAFGGRKITALADGTATTDAATFGQLSAAVQGRKGKDPWDWSTTANITLSGLGTQAGGEWTGTLTGTERILVKNQSTAAQNGSYTPLAGAWVRTTDADTGTEVTRASGLVLNGATLQGDIYQQTATVTTIGTDAQTWVKIAEGNTIYGADGTSVVLTGITFSRAALTGDITAAAGSAATTLATVNGNVGQFGTASSVSRPTVNAKGLVTAIDTVPIVIAESAVTNLVTDLAAKAADTAVVHLTGNETVAGIKTFSSVARAADAAAATDLMNRQSADARYDRLMTVTALKTANYSANANEYVPFDTTSGALIATLPTAPAAGTVVELKRVAGANLVTYNCGGSDALNVSGGSTSGTLQNIGHHVALTYNGSGIWYVETAFSKSGLDSLYSPFAVTIPTDKTADYTLVLGDQNASIGIDSATAKNLTAPPNSSVAWPIGVPVEIRQVGVGQITLVAGAGVTLRSRGGALKIAGQYGAASLLKIATDVWSVQGDLTT